jgi:hypothetical protein
VHEAIHDARDDLEFSPALATDPYAVATVRGVLTALRALTEFQDAARGAREEKDTHGRPEPGQ